ncbi:MAG: fructose 1,6-bisphosphatase, partial [Thaumarchaeota archaeon]|nr:fructose 1,6-bisphosphatase [Nitrososphaerota archaeon]
MNRAEVLLGASARARKAVSGLAGTERAGGDYGTGAGGAPSHAVDIAAEPAVPAYPRGRPFSSTIPA